MNRLCHHFKQSNTNKSIFLQRNWNHFAKKTNFITYIGITRACGLWYHRDRYKKFLAFRWSNPSNPKGFQLKFTVPMLKRFSYYIHHVPLFGWPQKTVDILEEMYTTWVPTLDFLKVTVCFWDGCSWSVREPMPQIYSWGSGQDGLGFRVSYYIIIHAYQQSINSTTFHGLYQGTCKTLLKPST